MEKMTEAVMDEIQDFGPGVKLLALSEPLPVEHCPCCGVGCYRTAKPPVAIRHTDPEWPTQSSCSIYINPAETLITLVFFLRHEQLFWGSIHLCEGRFLHYHTDGIDERVAIERRPSVRAQATRLVRAILKSWSPAMVFIGTGNPDKPDIIEDLFLPSFWEKRPK